MRTKERALQNNISNFFEILRLFKPYWRKWGLAILLLSFTSAIVSINPLLIKFAIDTIIPSKSILWLSIISITFIFFLLLTSILNIFQKYLFLKLGQQTVFTIQQSVLRRIINYPMSFFDNIQSGYLTARLSGDTLMVSIFFSENTASILISLINFIFALVILLVLDWKLTLFLLSICPLFAVVVKILSSRLRQAGDQAMEHSARTSSDIQEALAGINTIKSFSTENRESDRILKSLERSLQSQFRMNWFSNIWGPIFGIASGIASALILWFGGREIIAGHFSYGTFIAFNAFSIQLLYPIQMFFGLGLTLQPSISALERIKALTNWFPDDDTNSNKKKVNTLSGDIKFLNLDFSYDEKNFILNNFNLHILPGETISIVGPSGSGKTTLIRLLLGLYRPLSGSILLDDMDLSRLDLESVRNRIGIVSQDIFLFDDTIRNNIRYARPEAGDQDVDQAARLSGAFEFVTKLPFKYDTLVGERGAKLSGGQKQRISIARLILKNPDVLIFDEATSHLDSVSEGLVQDAIASLSRNKTTIIIAHRLSTVLSSRRIIVLDNGNICQEGVHSDLIRQPGLYQRLCQSQMLV